MAKGHSATEVAKCPCSPSQFSHLRDETRPLSGGQDSLSLGEQLTDVAVAGPGTELGGGPDAIGAADDLGHEDAGLRLIDDRHGEVADLGRFHLEALAEVAVGARDIRERDLGLEGVERDDQRPDVLREAREIEVDGLATATLLVVAHVGGRAVPEVLLVEAGADPQTLVVAVVGQDRQVQVGAPVSTPRGAETLAASAGAVPGHGDAEVLQRSTGAASQLLRTGVLRERDDIGGAIGVGHGLLLRRLDGVCTGCATRRVVANKF